MAKARVLPQLLFITAIDPAADGEILSLSSRIAIGVLSRDFDVSLAVVGPVKTTGLHRLRVDLGPMRVTGGFEASGADRPVEPGLRKYMQAMLGSEIINARLQTTIQRKAKVVDAVVVDSLLAWPYRPVGVKGPIAFVAHAIESRRHRLSGILGRLQQRKFRDYEYSVLNSADMVFAVPDLASKLSELGVPMRSLQVSFSKPDSARPTLADIDFYRTAKRIGYTGFLGDQRNIASLNWFLDNIWSVASKTLPGVEFHIVGKAPSRDLREKMASYENVKLHWSNDDQLLIDLRCRVVVEPLLFEDHVDAKLINAMARGIPTVTTRHAIKRAHFKIRPGVVVAESRETMVLAISRLLADPVVWNNAARESMQLARQQLPDFELAHCIRRELGRALKTP